MSQDVDGLIKEILLGGIGLELQTHGFQSFSVFYSNPYVTLLRREGYRYYIAGLNPGGAGEPQKGMDEYEWIQRRWKSEPRSAYLIEDDENWKTNFQPNMKRFGDCWLQPQNHMALRHIFSTNAIFARSPGADSLVGKDSTLFDLCWRWHRRFLDIIRPRIIIAISNDKAKPSAFNLFRDCLQNRSTEEPIKIYGVYSIKRSQGVLDLPSGPLEVRLVGLPHLSYCNVARNPDVIRMLRETDWL